MKSVFSHTLAPAVLSAILLTELAACTTRERDLQTPIGPAPDLRRTGDESQPISEQARDAIAIMRIRKQVRDRRASNWTKLVYAAGAERESGCNLRRQTAF